MKPRLERIEKIKNKVKLLKPNVAERNDRKRVWWELEVLDEAIEAKSTGCERQSLQRGKKKHKNRAEAVRVKVVRLDRGMNCDCEKEEKKNWEWEFERDPERREAWGLWESQPRLREG